jgi:hypothetical protein
MINNHYSNMFLNESRFEEWERARHENLAERLSLNLPMPTRRDIGSKPEETRVERGPKKDTVVSRFCRMVGIRHD